MRNIHYIGDRDAYENRDVANFDVPGEYLQAEIPNDKTVLLKLRAEFVNIVCDVNPDHKYNVTSENGGKGVVHAKVLHAIYGCIESSLQWLKNIFRKFG